MNRFLYALCAVVLSGTLLAGCASRSLPVEDEAGPSSSAVASEEVAVEPSSSEEESSSAPEKKYPLPELSGTDRMLLEDDALEFIKYFGSPDQAVSADALDQKQMLAFCLSQINREKDIQGYFFDKSDDGGELIPADLVTEIGERMFGATDFAPTDSGSYKEAQNCYLYKNADGYSAPDCELSELRGTVDGGVARDATFADGKSVRYSFKLFRRNGMPYLQLMDIAPRA